MKKLAIITTHPIQYYAPVFKLLHQRKNISVKVFYTWGEKAQNKYDPDFDKKIEWDIPLLEDYPFEWVENMANDPGSHHFKGIVNPGLIEQLKKWKPGAVLFFGWSYQSHLKAMRYFKGKIPVYFRGDSTLLDETPVIRKALKYIYLRWVYKHVDHAFYVGANNKAYFKKYGLTEKQLSFAPHAIDNERFAVDRSTEVIALKKKSGIPEAAILILFAGKLTSKKSPMLLLDSFSALKNANLHLLFVGNGELEEQLKNSAQGNGDIHFMEFQNQSCMPVVYQCCDLFCLPSKGPGETWGLAVNEAMAGGRAVLVSDKVGCAIDLVKENVNGAIFISENMDELTARLKELTESKDKLKSFGKHSAEMIRDWSFKSIAEAIENKLIHEKI